MSRRPYNRANKNYRGWNQYQKTKTDRQRFSLYAYLLTLPFVVAGLALYNIFSEFISSEWASLAELAYPDFNGVILCWSTVLGVCIALAVGILILGLKKPSGGSN